MGTIQRLIRNTTALNMQDEIQYAMYRTSQKLAEFQRLQMLYGQRSDGKRIGRYASKEYARKKHALNPLAGFRNVDLKLEGYFHGDIFVDVRDGHVIFDSGNEKTIDLIGKYGETILGLNPTFAGEYSRDVLKPEVTKNIKAKILK